MLTIRSGKASWIGFSRIVPKPGHRDEIDLVALRARRRPGACRRHGRSRRRSSSRSTISTGTPAATGDLDRAARTVDEHERHGQTGDPRTPRRMVPLPDASTPIRRTRLNLVEALRPSRDAERHLGRSLRSVGVRVLLMFAAVRRFNFATAARRLYHGHQQADHGRQDRRRERHRVSHLHVPSLVRNRVVTAGTAGTTRSGVGSRSSVVIVMVAQIACAQVHRHEDAGASADLGPGASDPRRARHADRAHQAHHRRQVQRLRCRQRRPRPEVRALPRIHRCDRPRPSARTSRCRRATTSAPPAPGRPARRRVRLPVVHRPRCKDQ